MFAQIEPAEAQGRTWDVIIAGSSFAAMFFLRGLPPGLSVLLIERGSIRPHAEQLRTGLIPPAPFRMENSSGQRKDWVAQKVFGGNSNCWWGQVPRFLPSDFQLSAICPEAAPWPLTYDDLEPFYSEVEAVMEVAGGGVDHLYPRSTGFPFPPHRHSRFGQQLAEADPANWVPVATARSNGGSRVQCCVNGCCHLCPADAKFTVENGLAAFERPEAKLMTQAEVREVIVEGGRATGVAVRLADGAQVEVRAGLVALATNAIYNAAILLRSGLSSPALGCYLHEQASEVHILDLPGPGLFGGSSITTHGYLYRDGPERATRGAVLIEVINAPPLLRTDPGRWTHRSQIKLIVEDLPQAENRVTLEEDEPFLTWLGHSAYAGRGLDHARDNLRAGLPVAVESMALMSVSSTEAHIQGTHRMGSDPARSVVDARLACHEVENLLALGAGTFPTCSASNPTLTLSALALMAGRSL